MMRQSGLIEEASIAFNIATNEMDDDSYAIFGGYNPDQVVGGKEGLIEFPNFHNKLETWAIGGEGAYYNKRPLHVTDSKLPAVIDTGSTLMAMPPQVFAPLKESWQKDLGEEHTVHC